MPLNIAKKSPLAENCNPRARDRADAYKYPTRDTVVTRPDLGGWPTPVFMGRQMCWKEKEQTNQFSYLHGLVKFVGKEERLVLDALNW